MKAKVNKNLCIGCGACTVACPDCFEMGKDGKAQAKRGCKKNCCDLTEVAESCPVQAISVE